jgi:ABC-type taurine transport system ATPase subunit
MQVGLPWVAQYPKIQYAYQAAGMEIVNDNVRADRILSEVLAPDRKLDRDEQDNLIIVTGFLSDRQGYQQHLFAWPEFTPLEPTP